MRLLIYAANLHVGGGVQVAASVISELALGPHDVRDVTVWASTTVDANLSGLGFDPARFADYEVIDHVGARARWSPERKRMRGFDAVFVIFGPHYLGRLQACTVMGFAQPWIIYPRSEAYALQAPVRRFLTRAKFFVQSQLFKRADRLVVELDHVKNALVKRGIAHADCIEVVNNCVASLYLEPQKWQPVDLPPRRARMRLGFVGRNYLHKNTRVFPALLELLRTRHGMDVELLVTFTPEEWAACDHKFRAAVVNVGVLPMAQCPAFYHNVDAVVFPSLLECFSATPLEAMVMQKPLFASDRGFVRDVCGDFADYFNPMSPPDMARVIADALKRPVDANRLQLARAHALEFSRADARALRYLTILRDAPQQRFNDRSLRNV